MNHIRFIRFNFFPDGHLEFGARVGSEQTLARRIIPTFDLIFIDECHLQFKKILAWIDDPKMQSTPHRAERHAMVQRAGKHYHRLINPTSIKDLIEKKILCPFVVFAPPGPDLSQVRTVAGDYHEGDLSTSAIPKSLLPTL